ncbi:uncharacterized protein BX664DRAFT_159289 [Halteromyces radiatus]|uniref:uncharacterized protein n=1 Tax=Halteromyces radiatus TaxID=101107 RepID=UPI00221FAE42|nr:uncharacterized protein BX664DRAFT_159289 [Halteromyces radiatus]KAI8086522.1 hypothetical protein BX664DRAFT_159289 [Halteromyces radiatus]
MTMTSASSIPGFQPAVMYAILIPIAVGTAITLVVTVLIWPEDTMTNYLICLSNSLNEYNSFFKDHSDAFVSLSKTSLHVGLRQLHSKMLDSVLILIDSKRAVQREILYSYLSSKDCSKITKIVKQMRAPLHGIGFSLLKKKEGLGLDDAENEQDAFTYIVTDQERQAFNDALTDLIPLYTEMASLCHVILMTTSDRFSKFGNSPRSATTTFLWPFIRFNIFKRWRQNKSTNDNDLEKDTTNTTLEYKNNLDRLGKLVAEMEAIATPGMITFLETIHLQEDKDPRYGLLYVLFCYQMNLKAHSTNIIELAETLIQLEHDRPSKRFWLPSITLKKWFQSSVLDPQDGGDNPTSSDQGLIRTRTRPDALDDDNLAASSRLDTKNYKEKKSRKKAKFLHLDPDLYPPSNKIERFFFSLHLFKKWCFSINTFFAFKTAVAVVLLSIPAYRREDVGWYNEWQGRWAQITLVLWLFPMAGMFYLSSLLRFVGTVIGGVLGIVVWEISRGNPYGLSVLCFVCFMFFQYAFLFGPPYMRPLHMVAIVTLVLVTIYEMQYIQDQVSNHDEVYTVAGKRMLLVIIGILGATILNMIPSQVNGRVELRRRLAITITQVGRMYSLLTSSYMVPHENPPTENQRKTFRKWMVEVQRQIADERALLMTSKFEPSLRGKFPLKEYTTLVDRVENMADLVDAMVYAARSIDDDWRDHISTILMKERQDYASQINLVYISVQY